MRAHPALESPICGVSASLKWLFTVEGVEVVGASLPG